MIQYIFLIAFFAFLGCHIIAEYLENKKGRFATKPLLMVLLILYYAFSISLIEYDWLLILALIFGWLGDISLMIGREGKWFMLGLGSFLIGHIFYILSFLFSISDITQFPFWGFIFFIPSILIALVFYSKIKDKMGELQKPTLIYILVITIMSIIATLRFAELQGISFYLVWIGSLLFMISDGIIALNKFHKKISHSGVYIMLTYGLGQFFIVQGIIFAFL
ncbi:MAG: conserved membrane protein of unknown function [Promethearchaeota archaeon]|nr:MAG: conserved membrane protein of unknown function [Candidatus Lokiarchaeota archaeon]